MMAIAGVVLRPALDLVPPNGRWTPARKEAVVKAIAEGRVDRDQVDALLGVSAEELASWEARHGRHGQAGLKTTRLQGFR